MSSQPNITDHLSEYVKNMHNQQHAKLYPYLLQLLNLSKQESLTLNLLTQQLNFTLHDLPQNLNTKPQYFQSQKYVIPALVRKIGLISKQLSQLCKFDTQQEQFLAEFQTLKFMKLFPAEKKPKYAQQQIYQPLMVDFIKPLFPRMNVHKDNLPLYMPFYHSIDSYCTQAPIGNPSWQLSRRMFNKIYKQQMSLLNDETRDQNILQQQINKKDAWFQLLMCDTKYLKRYQIKGGIDYIWALMHFYYVHQTLKPYRNVLTNEFNQQSQSITLNLIQQTLRKRIDEESQLKSKFVSSFVLYQLTQNIDDLFSITQLVKKILEDNLLAVRDYKITKQDSRLNFISLVNAVCTQLFRNLLQIEQAKQMRDQNRINTLKAYMQITIELINDCVTHRLLYHEFYLRIAYPSHLVDPQERIKNQKILFNILQHQLNKDTEKTTEIYPFPQYIYFESEFYEQFSKIYLKKHPNQIIEIANFLPGDVAAWRLLNSPNLSNFQEFLKIRQVLLDNKQRYIESIKQRVPDVTENNYVNFIKSWDIYHKLFQNEEVYQQEFTNFMKKFKKCQQTINFLYCLELPQLLRQHLYFVFDKGENILKITQHMISGFEEELRQVNTESQKQIVKQYSQCMNNPKFESKLLSKLTEEQKDQFWKKWTVVYLADQSLVKELIGGDEIQMQEDQQSGQSQEQQQYNPHKTNKGPQKQTNQVIIMDLQD